MARCSGVRAAVAGPDWNGRTALRNIPKGPSASRPRAVRTKPGSAALAVTPVPLSRSLSSRVNKMVSSLVVVYVRRWWKLRPVARSSKSMPLTWWCLEDATVTMRGGAEDRRRSPSSRVSKNGGATSLGSDALRARRDSPPLRDAHGPG